MLFDIDFVLLQIKLFICFLLEERFQKLPDDLGGAVRIFNRFGTSLSPQVLSSIKAMKKNDVIISLWLVALLGCEIYLTSIKALQQNRQ